MPLRDDLIKHQLFVQRFGAKQGNDLFEMLSPLLSSAEQLVESNLTDSEIRKQLRRSINDLPNSAINTLTSLAVIESDFSARTITRNSDKVLQQANETVLNRALKNKNMDINRNNKPRDARKRSLLAAHKIFARRKADEMTQIIRDGRSRSEPVEDIKTRLRERRNGLQKTQARSLGKTSVVYTTNLARAETLKKNNIDKVIFLLGESREHTAICLSLANKTFDINDAPTPPLHWGCNSHIEPIDI